MSKSISIWVHQRDDDEFKVICYYLDVILVFLVENHLKDQQRRESNVRATVVSLLWTVDALGARVHARVCLCVCVRACWRAYVFACERACVFACEHECMRASVRACVFVRVHACVRVSLRAIVRVCVCVCMRA